MAGGPLGDHPGAAAGQDTQHLGVQGVVDAADHHLVAECGRHGVPVQEETQTAQLVTARERLVERLPQQGLLVGEDAVRDDLHLVFSRRLG